MTNFAVPTPARIDQHSPTEMLVVWNNREEYALAFSELRFHCPCAGCVDENSGERLLQREDIPKGIKPKGVQLVGRYAVQVNWNDGHSTGMYHYDRLYDLCKKKGLKLK